MELVTIDEVLSGETIFSGVEDMVNYRFVKVENEMYQG